MATSDVEYESAVEDEGGQKAGELMGDGQPPIFDLGKTTFLVNQEGDIIDNQAVLVNPVDSYVGKFIGQFLSTKSIGATLRGSTDITDLEDELEGEEGPGIVDATSSSRQKPKYWKILGTFSSLKSNIQPFLWAAMKTDDFDAYFKEACKCAVIIFDLTADPSPERFDELRGLCDTLRSQFESFSTSRVLIVISSLHSWSHTKKTKGDQPFTEDDYRRRHTKPLYRDLQLLERYVVATGKLTKGKLKCYVIGAGAIYGAEESCFHHWFITAWHNAKYLPVYGNGKNNLPAIYLHDLAKIVQNVMDAPPKLQRYLIAVDPVICQQDQIAKAISRVLGTGHIKRVPEEDIYLNKELTTFQADQHLLDLKIESAFAQENFNMEFTAERGIVGLMEKICAEYKSSRNLEPLKVCILGPPASGKSTIARQISDLYRLNHFTKEEMITNTLDVMKEAVQSSLQPPDNGLDGEMDESISREARQILSEVDKYILERHGGGHAPGSAGEMESEMDPTAMSKPRSSTYANEVGISKMSDELFVRIARWRLLSPQCQNQGFILDGFPENLNQARMLFQALDPDVLDSATEEEEMMNEGKDVMDPRLVPDRVIVLEASDEFLTQRLQSIPACHLQEKHKDKAFAKALTEYRELNSVYESTFLFYLDLQEIMYYPIDITTGEGQLLQNVVGRVMDMLGKPRNYGLSREQEEALRNSQKDDKSKLEESEKEDLAIIESREMEERRENIQQWMEKLAKVKREEFEREEAALVPLRQYLMAHVVPTLTKGLIDVTRARPNDPVEFLAEFLFSNNPGSLNPTIGEKFPKGNK